MKSKITITAVYFIGLFSFFMILLGYLPNSFGAHSGLKASSSIFYLTWMSILFAIGISQIYNTYSNNHNSRFQAKILFTGFVFLMLILPGPFSETIFSSILRDYSLFYYLTSTLALVISVYILFKQKSSNQILSALKLSLNFLSDVILVTDENFNIEIAEGDVQKTLKIKSDEIIGRNLNQLVLDSGYLNDYKNYSLKKKLIKGLFDTKYTSNDGNVSFMNFSIAPVVDNDHVVGYILIGRDISDRKKLEEKLRTVNEGLEDNIRLQTSELAEMNRRLHLDIEERKYTEEKLRKITSELKEAILSKDKMFSIVAHDLRSPFVSLLGFSEVLVQDIDSLDKEDTKQFSLKIFNAAKRVSHLLENLLQWSKIQTDRMQFQREIINLNKLVSDILILFEGNALNKDINLVSNLDADTNVFADKNMLETVIRNLISNALKFTNSGGTVEIICRTNEGMSEISVKDSGIGIPEENIPTIFAIDQFVSTPDTENKKGSGLGLILTKEFIEKNGGELKVDSELGMGTTIKFTVPNSQ